jgi:hypothetical protein
MFNDTAFLTSAPTLNDPLFRVLQSSWGTHNPSLGLNLVTNADLKDEMGQMGVEWPGFTEGDDWKGEGSPYRRQAKRFCWKPLAIDWFVRDMLKWNGQPEWLVWLGSDVEAIATLDQDFRRSVDMDDPNCLVSTLMRRSIWDHSENDFLALRVAHPSVRTVIREWAGLMRTGQIYLLPQWHDAYAMDVMLRALPEERVTDLSLGLSPVHGLNPWPLSSLGRYFLHNKGEARKSARYTP